MTAEPGKTALMPGGWSKCAWLVYSLARSPARGEGMERRHFIQAAASSVLLPSLLAWPRLPPARADHVYAFVDERFERARRVAAAWRESGRLIAVQGDITPFWRRGLERAAREKALSLRGITTESFRFCLSVLLSEHGVVDARVSRVDQDLLLWTMRSAPKS